MNQDAIFQPFLATMLLTLVVWTYMYGRRLPFIFSSGLDPKHMTPQELARVSPPRVANPSDNLKNLFELPTVFYAVVLYLHATHRVDAAYLWAAWGFFLFRLLHSAVHCTFNFIPLRFVLYVISACAVWFMVVRAAFTDFAPGTTLMSQTQLTDFAQRYAAAWSSRDPGKLAAFYAKDGSLTVNDGAPAVGRAAITQKANGFMTAFPDMLVKLDEAQGDGRHAIFRWTWTGTNTGPGGTGRPVRLQGYEDWTLGADGLIRASKGHYDEAEYWRQLQADPGHVP